MSTPIGIVFPMPNHEEIVEALEKELQRQREQTPENEFMKEDLHSDYRFFCEQEHRIYTFEEIDDIRKGVHDEKYWECEALKLKADLFELIWNDLLQQHNGEKMSRAEKWRDVTMDLHRRLIEHGYTEAQVRESRLAIEFQSYWEPEFVCLRSATALREEAMYDRIRLLDEIDPSRVERRQKALFERRRQMLIARRDRREKKMRDDGSKSILKEPEAIPTQTIRPSQRTQTQARDNGVPKRRKQLPRAAKRVC